ncbi:MAG: hypothetical protein ACR2GO_09340, partial [Candidatus Limnocylindria bacterium]
MQRFRSTWLALIGGALLVTLSISAAFGAAPSGTTDATRGQTIAAFVHELVFGSADQNDDELGQEDENLDENESDETDETDETDELAEDSHGECVSEVARDKEASAESGENNGTVVSEAARVTCWEPDDEEDLTDPEEDEEDVTEEVEDIDSHGACVSEVARDKSAIGGKNDNHGGAVSEAAHDCGAGEVVEEDAAAVDEGDAEAAAAKEQRNAEKAAAHAAAQAEKAAAKTDRKAEHANRGNAKANNCGGGNGKGHGKPEL